MQSQLLLLVCLVFIASAVAFVPMAVRNAKLQQMQKSSALQMSKAAEAKKAEKEKRKLLQAGPDSSDKPKPKEGAPKK